MKNFEFQSLGLMELDAEEMMELEGGILPVLIVLACAALLSSCGNTINVQVNSPAAQAKQDNHSKNSDTLRHH